MLQICDTLESFEYESFIWLTPSGIHYILTPSKRCLRGCCNSLVSHPSVTSGLQFIFFSVKLRFAFSEEKKPDANDLSILRKRRKKTKLSSLRSKFKAQCQINNNICILCYELLFWISDASFFDQQFWVQIDWDGFWCIFFASVALFRVVVNPPCLLQDSYCGNSIRLGTQRKRINFFVSSSFFGRNWFFFFFSNEMRTEQQISSAYL